MSSRQLHSSARKTDLWEPNADSFTEHWKDISESGAGQALWKCSLSTDTCSTGQSQSARTVCGRENAKYKHSGRSDRSAPVCVSEVKRWEAFFMAERQ